MSLWESVIFFRGYHVKSLSWMTAFVMTNPHQKSRHDDSKRAKARLAKASSVLYSLSLTAKLNGKDPFQVMTEVFRKLPCVKTIEDYEKLTNLFLTAKPAINTNPQPP